MNQPMKPIKTKEMFARDLKISNSNILAMIAFTLINIVLIIVNADMSFPFSAAVPMYLVLLFAELCGMRSAEFYELNYGANWEQYEFIGSGVFWTVVVMALVMVAVYFVLWHFSKKKKVFSIILMVLYAIDTLGLLVFCTAVYAFDFYTIIDFAFHAWVFYYLILALKAWDGMGYAPSEAELATQVMTSDGAPTFDEGLFNSVTEESVQQTSEETEQSN